MVRRSKPVSPFAVAAFSLALAASWPALATSSASSVGSSASSASSASVSESFGASSDSSSKTDKVADGDYRIIQVAAAEQPGKLRLTLQGTGDASVTFVLFVPEVTVQQAALALGDTVTARVRSFGWEFAAAATRETFFLVVHDAQQREFVTRKLTL